MNQVSYITPIASGSTGTPRPVAAAETPSALDQIGLTITEYKSVWDKLRENYVSNGTQGMLWISLDVGY